MGQMEDLRAFVLIVDNESIGKAAELEGIAKSAMSRRLRLLEERLGTELIARTTRQWSLTSAGNRYYSHA
ncbi:MAG: LysR family transcriptional regulator, partial [Albidovulum sp.]|uniref:LysR family transcriptional regulator n=1 Tax=Albidovulum sp. TaxID=1872424 RepID=UPI003C8BF200